VRRQRELVVTIRDGEITHLNGEDIMVLTDVDLPQFLEDAMLRGFAEMEKEYQMGVLKNGLDARLRQL
jgi:hypothetical protein